MLLSPKTLLLFWLPLSLLIFAMVFWQQSDLTEIDIPDVWINNLSELGGLLGVEADS